MLRKRKRQASPLQHDGQTSMGYVATPASNIADSPKAPSSNSDRNLVDFLLDNHDVRQLVLDRLNVHDFAMLAATNKRLRASLFEERFDVNHTLKRYFRDPVAFRRLLYQCNAFVGGMFPLSIFEGRCWQGIPLDIYVKPDKYIHLKDFITAGERYDVVSETDESDVDFGMRKRISTFKRISPDGRTEAIQLIHTYGDPLLWVFTNSTHLTPESCLLTWNKLISLYPRVTFLEHKMYYFHGVLTDELGTKLSYFASNHWPLEDLTLEDSMWSPTDDRNLLHAKPFIHSSLDSLRRVGDSHAYHIRLNTDGIGHETSYVPPTVLDYSEFALHPYSRGTGLDFGCFEINHPLLRWRWTAGYPGDDSIFQTILNRLHNLLPYEVLRLPIDQRPVGYFSEPDDRGVRLERSLYQWADFEKPASWQYQDHMIPEWYDFYLEREARREAGVKAH